MIPVIQGDQKIWKPDDQYSLRNRRQPFYKLHGSTNWHDPNGQMLVIGYNKHATISSNRVLKQYHETFAATLDQDDTRLVTIGYGFGDEHINAAIRRNFATNRLRLFLIDPMGTDATIPPLDRRSSAIRAANPYLDIIDGYSLRGLSEIFGGRETSELANILNFLEQRMG